MANLIWLLVSAVFCVFSIVSLVELLKSLKGKKYEILWNFFAFLISGFITGFGFYVFYAVDFAMLEKGVKILITASFLTAVVSFFVVKKTFILMDWLMKKRKRFIDLNFVIEGETQDRADDLEAMNRKLALQTEILSEKEVELKKINSDLVKAEKELEEEKKSVESKVIARTMELKAKKDVVESLLKQKTKFINQLSHDLRTPLTPLLNLLPMVKKQVKGKEGLHLLDICEKNTEYLKRLVLDTLSLAKLETKTADLNISKVSAQHLLGEILSSNKIEHEKGDVIISNDIDKKLKIDADKVKMREVFENIINNAIKYNESKTKKIKVTSKTKKDLNEFRFEDNGMGIETKDLNSIFDEFYKIDPSRHQRDSSGLGLSIAKRIVEMHNGEILAESEGLGKGTTIVIILPIF